MRIKYVTMTGADDHTSLEKLADLSERYPFAEWGILFSQAKAGVPRYPSFDWVLDLCVTAAMHRNMCLSAHLCGKWVQDAINGEITLLKDWELSDAFSRVQLNCYKDRLRKAISSEPLWQAMGKVPQQVILGGDHTNIELDPERCWQHHVCPLFDASGGHGRLPKSWPKPLHYRENFYVLSGYAGGLGPHNIIEEIEKIEEIAGEADIWVDMETQLRDGKDEFSLEKCEEVLRLVEEWAVQRSPEEDKDVAMGRWIG